MSNGFFSKVVTSIWKTFFPSSYYMEMESRRRKAENRYRRKKIAERKVEEMRRSQKMKELEAKRFRLVEKPATPEQVEREMEWIKSTAIKICVPRDIRPVDGHPRFYQFETMDHNTKAHVLAYVECRSGEGALIFYKFSYPSIRQETYIPLFFFTKEGKRHILKEPETFDMMKRIFSEVEQAA